MRNCLTGLMLMLLAAACRADRPNIVYILADDLGYGDVQCLNPEGKIPTPNIDRLAAEGMIFTDAHSSSAVCTPTRYGVLTGRYNWRSRLKQGVLYGYSPHLIESGRLTVPALLGRHGYHTACIGKWHLGMNWPLKDGGVAESNDDAWKIDYTKPIANGPTSVGFNTFFGISASLDMHPYVYIEDDRVVTVPTVEKAFHRPGPAAADFEAVDVLPKLTERAVNYIGTRAKTGKPFFLYMPLNSPHTPIVPTERWRGRSGINAYADFVMQTDAAVGQVLAALDEAGVADNTLVVFTSDNGCSPQAKFKELKEHGHNPNHVFRGHKADIFEGGHRIPFLVRWPGKVAPGSQSDQTICLTDLMASCADVLEIQLPDSAGEDSVSILPALRGTATEPLREAVVHHSFNGSFAIRQGKWKLILCPDSGGWSHPRPGRHKMKDLPPVQLYDLSVDIGERTNVQHEHPQVVERLSRLMKRYVADGRSTPGATQANTTPVDLWRYVHGRGKRAEK